MNWQKPKSAKQKQSTIKNQVTVVKSLKMEKLENQISEFMIEDELLDLQIARANQKVLIEELKRK